MEHEIQKASLWKRIAAGILDLILILVLATGSGAALSAVTGYDSYNAELQEKYDYYIEKYDFDPNLSPEAYAAMSEAEQEAYGAKVKAADAALRADSRAMQVYGIVSNLILVIITGSTLLAMLVVEFLLPLLFGNGQTLGKKIFSLCLVRVDGVKINGYQHFTRAILGKFTVETMIPVYVAVLLLQGQSVMLLVLVVAALFLAELIILSATRNNSLLHDLMAGTVVVDYSTQRIFKSTEDLIAYQKRIAAERANRQIY